MKLPVDWGSIYKFEPRMFALIILLFIGAYSTAPKLYNLEKIREPIPIAANQRITIESIEDAGAQEVWVIGRYPSEAIICEEGRFGDRYKDYNIPGKPWVQKFTFMTGAHVPGQLMEVMFWFIHPHFAEQYFNDPEAYLRTHKDEPFRKKVQFRLWREDDDDL